MKYFVKNLANLIKVKTIVTMMVVTVFSVLAIKGTISADNVMIIISMVISSPQLSGIFINGVRARLL